MSNDRFTHVLTNTTGTHVTRRGLINVVAGIGASTASSAFHVPTVIGQAKGQVVFWTTHSDVGLDALKQIGEDFNAQSETTVVEIVQRLAADVTDSSSLITAVRGGKGPDVYLLDRFIVAERAAQGLLQDLTPFMQAAGDSTDLTEKYVDFAAAEATYDNAPYAVPFDTDVRCLFFNRGLLTEAGVDLALFDYHNGPMTFDHLAEVIAAVDVDGGDHYERLGFVPYFGQGFHYVYGFAIGGEFFDYENCQVTPDNEQVLAGAKWVYDYCSRYGAEKLYGFETFGQVGAASTDNSFVQGRLATMLNGTWMFAQFEKYQPDDDIGYTYTPVANDGDPSSTMAGGWSGVIPEGARNPEGGYEFVKYLCGPEGSRTYVQMYNVLPVLREHLEDPSLFSRELEWFVDNIFPGTKYRPPLPVGAKYWDELGAAWDAIILNISDPATAMAQVKSNTMRDLEAGGYCPIAAPPVEDPTPASRRSDVPDAQRNVAIGGGSSQHRLRLT